MGEPLTSKLFTGPDVDDATKTKLQDCADGRPTEMISHFNTTTNQTGTHVRLVKEALRRAQARDPSLQLPPFFVDDNYDDGFADAIYAYKKQRGILNYAGQLDKIVGIKTIRALDNEAKGGPHVDPGPFPKKPDHVFPKPLQNCVTDKECPTSTEFDVTLLSAVNAGLPVGKIVEATIMYFAIHDRTNNLSAMYKFLGGGVSWGSPVSYSGGGPTKTFSVKPEGKVTRFGPSAYILSGSLTPTSVPTQQPSLSGSFLKMLYEDGKYLAPGAAVFDASLDGFATPSGVGADVALFQNVSRCGSGAARGCFRRILTKDDLLYG
jgi:hypothetical protein